MATLHLSFVGAELSVAARCTLIVHGILGSGANLRLIAQRLSQLDPQRAFALVDLRMHGRSQGFAPPHDIAACARDLGELTARFAAPVDSIIGHSFGGKVAIAYAAEHAALAHLALLDSAPGARSLDAASAETLAVLAVLEALPPVFERREDFIAAIERQGLSRRIADWLAMNLARTDGSFRLRLDLSAIRSLLDSYFTLDAWPLLESLKARVTLVIGGLSQVFSAAELARAKTWAQDSAGRVRVRVLPQAGHWVHVDDPDGVVKALSE